MSLADLEARIRREAGFNAFPNRAWMPPPSPASPRVHDVVIIGAGQSGLAVAYALMRESLTNIVVLDAAPQGREGPWTTYARMLTLRTPKMLSGLDFGNPSLTPQAWFEAQWGAPAWETLGKMPRAMWQDYLLWYRRVLDIPVLNDVRVTGLVPGTAGITLETAAGASFVGRKIVLCSGIEGSGRWAVPRSVAESLPCERYAHTADAIDFGALAGKRIGILGNGASAFDNAATALEHGAASVDLCLRKPAFPTINAHKWMETPGFLGHYATLPDLARWRFMRQVTGMSQPPPQDTLWRCRAFPNFAIHTGADWTRVTMAGDDIVVATPAGTMRFDFLIAGTGLAHGLAMRPELASLAADVATWTDRFTPPEPEADPYLGAAPYLGPGFEFLEKRPGAAPHLARIHNFTYGATLSMGLSAASISGMRYGVPRLVRGVVGDLFREDAAFHFQSLLAYDEKDIKTLDLPDDRSLVPVMAPAVAVQAATGRRNGSDMAPQSA